MDFAIASAVFLTANLWGLYGAIPFTTIHPSNSFWDRTLGSLQLASTVYTLEQIQPDLVSTRIDFLPEPALESPMPEALRDFLDRVNVTIDSVPMPTTTARINPSSVSRPSGLSLLSPGEINQRAHRSDRGGHYNVSYENVILALLIVTLGGVIIQIVRQSDDSRYMREFTNNLVVQTQNALVNTGSLMQTVFRSIRDEVRGDIRGMEHDILDRVRNLRDDLREDFRVHADAIGENLEIVKDGIRNYGDRSRDDLREQGSAIQEKVRTLREEVHENFIDQGKHISRSLSGHFDDFRHLQDEIRATFQDSRDHERTHSRTMNDRLDELINSQTMINHSMSSFPQQLQQIHLGIERLCTFVSVLQSQRLRLVPGESDMRIVYDNHTLNRRFDEFLQYLERAMDHLSSSLSAFSQNGLAPRAAENSVGTSMEATADAQTQLSDPSTQIRVSLDTKDKENGERTENAQSWEEAGNGASNTSTPQDTIQESEMGLTQGSDERESAA